MELSKKELKFVIAVTGVLLLAKLYRAASVFVPLFTGISLNSTEAIGIIGGADGPTAIYVATDLLSSLNWLFPIFSLMEIVFFIFLIVKSIKALRK
ncbi:MAG: sodium ion-translocating decarboxylase subunit beta [Oscillospiraceae bacterium]|nr:sodium ion-translocating decarboxylase subunit beta [Oscillospiraceae bacterium]